VLCIVARRSRHLGRASKQRRSEQRKSSEVSAAGNHDLRLAIAWQCINTQGEGRPTRNALVLPPSSMARQTWRGSLRLAVALCVGLSVCTSGRAARAELVDDSAHAGEPPGYRDAVSEGLREFEARNYPEARSLFLRAHALSPSARTHRALGLVEFELRNYVDSIHHLRAARETSVKSLNEAQLRETESILARAQAFVGQYRVRTTPATSELWLDGSQLHVSDGEPVLLTIGEHSLECRAPGYLQKQQKLAVKGGESGDLTFALVPITDLTAPSGASASATRPWYKSGWLWAAVGVVVVGAAAGGTSYALLHDDKSPRATGGSTSTVLPGP
jgi:hypothetical protein